VLRILVTAVLLLFPSLVLGEGGKLYYFFSFSLPEESILQAMRQAEELKATMVLRGLKNNDWNTTLKEILTLSQRSETNPGVIIDPTLFEDFEVKVVPAVVYQYEDGSYYKVSGNIPLPQALEIILEKKGPCP